jgi:opine dehydrogenase
MHGVFEEAHQLATGHTVQTGAASQAQDTFLGSSWTGDVCVVGDGAEAMAIAGLLSSQLRGQDGACNITMLGGVTPPHIEFASALSLQAQRLAAVVSASGSTSGGGMASPVSCYYGEADIPFSKKSHDVEECLDGAQAIVVCGPATVYSAIARTLAPALIEGTTIGLVGAPMLGAMQFGAELKRFRPDLTVNIVELDCLFNHARASADGVSVLGLRRRVNLSGRSRNETRRALPLACLLSPGFLPSSNMLERGFLDAESVVRPVFVLSALIGGRIDALGDLSSLLNRSNLAMLAELEQEISRLSFSYKCALADFARALREESFCQVNFEPQPAAEDDPDQDACYEATLAEALVGISGEWFKGLEWSHRLAQEVLTRYVSEHLVLLSDLAHVAKIPVPVLDGVISLASALVGFDLRNRARGLNRLGLNDLSQNELLELVND